MPRIARGIVGGYIYHILNRGNGRQDIFHKDGDYQSFINLIKESKTKYSIKIFAYCIMPNHFHLVVEPEKGEDLSKWMQWLMTSHVRRYHRHYNSSGHIWQGRYKSFIVQNNEYLLMVLRYVENNPVRKGLVKMAKDWPWSSHKERIYKNENIISDSPINLPENWEEYVNKPLINNELEMLRHSVARQMPYGENDWRIKICKDLGLESTIRPIGRPRKDK